MPVHLTLPANQYFLESFQLKFAQEINVLSSQKLSELRDAIKCPADRVVVGEFSEKPQTSQDVTAAVSLLILNVNRFFPAIFARRLFSLVAGSVQIRFLLH